MKWQPIETCPKEHDSQIVIWCQDIDEFFYECYWGESIFTGQIGWAGINEEGEIVSIQNYGEPSHWAQIKGPQE